MKLIELCEAVEIDESVEQYSNNTRFLTVLVLRVLFFDPYSQRTLWLELELELDRPLVLTTSLLPDHNTFSHGTNNKITARN